MTTCLRSRPRLEYLEDRTVPATGRLVSGTLLISNPKIMGTTTSLTLTQDPVVQNKFNVKDGVANNGNLRRRWQHCHHRHHTPKIPSPST